MERGKRKNASSKVRARRCISGADARRSARVVWGKRGIAHTFAYVCHEHRGSYAPPVLDAAGLPVRL